MVKLLVVCCVGNGCTQEKSILLDSGILFETKTSEIRLCIGKVVVGGLGVFLLLLETMGNGPSIGHLLCMTLVHARKEHIVG